MNMTHPFIASLRNKKLNMFDMLKVKHDDWPNIDEYGVGAMMPQDMPEATLLANTELYGV
jgi:hypothetical protein